MDSAGSVAPPVEAPAAEGYLMQYSPSKFNKWQRRWFTLDRSSRVLRCYQKHTRVEPGSETASVSGAIGCPAPVGPRGRLFISRS